MVLAVALVALASIFAEEAELRAESSCFNKFVTFIFDESQSITLFLLNFAVKFYSILHEQFVIFVSCTDFSICWAIFEHTGQTPRMIRL